MPNDDYSCAQDFFCSIMTPDDVLLVKDLVNKTSRAPVAAKRYLDRRCRDVKELEQFFRESEYLFFLENKRVALLEDRNNDSEMAENFFREKLEKCNKPVDYMQLKRQYLKYAPENVQLFITQFYPGDEIKHFFKKRPDSFVVYKNNTVFLIEVDSVEFYKKQLKLQTEPKTFIQFRGHIGRADPHIQAYINRNFFGSNFRSFLLRHSNVFKLDDDGIVTLVSAS